MDLPISNKKNLISSQPSDFESVEEEKGIEEEEPFS